MPAERKSTGRGRQQPAAPTHVGSRPGLANRGFRSMDPERQGETAGRNAASRGALSQHEDGTVSRSTARDASRRSVRRTSDSRENKDAGSR